jgi:hypothetical protein
MEQKKFIQSLRRVVREELRSVIKQELTEILQEGLQPTISELQPTKKPIQEQRSVVKNKVKFKKNKYSDILNETTSLREQASIGDYASMMNEDINMSSKDAIGFGMQRNGTMPATMQDPETGKTLQVDSVVANAITKDYSALMKAIDNKKGK